MLVSAIMNCAGLHFRLRSGDPASLAGLDELNESRVVVELIFCICIAQPGDLDGLEEQGLRSDASLIRLDAGIRSLWLCPPYFAGTRGRLDDVCRPYFLV
jgi:hypothetical protein